MEYWNNGKNHPAKMVFRDMSLTEVTGNTELESGVMEYWSTGVLEYWLCSLSVSDL